MTQRWNHHRDSYRPAGEPIDPSRYGIEVLADDTTARAFVERHHYSASYPAARVRIGLYRMRELVGVAVFSVPMQAAAIPRWTGTEAGVELGRFVLLDDVPANGETWFLARAFRALEGELPDLRAVLSYSDPLPRRRADGTLVCPGHIGTIYQAHNGRHLGRAKAEALVLDADGRTVSRRGLSKLRNGERGSDAVYRRLVDAGAPARSAGEDPAAYVERALRSGPFRKVKHPGNLVYVWAVGDDRRATLARFGPAQPNPRREGDPRNTQLALLAAA
jgi:hypothetical protein